MNAKKLHISLALTLGLLALAGALALLGTWACPEVALAQGPDGHATYYVAPNCTGLPTPCYTTVQAAVDAVDDPDDVIEVAEGTYNNVNFYGGLAQIVYITKSLTLRGGYNNDFTAWDPEAYTTTLDAQSNGRVVYISGDITPTVEGFRITGGSATGLGGDPFGDAGGGIYILDATVTISRNVIVNNSAVGGFFVDGLGGGVYAAESTPTLRGNLILDNQATGGFFASGAGGGLYFVESQPVLEANQIRGNQTGGDFGGTGGGVEMAACPDFVLINNVIADNVAPDGGSGLWIDHMSGVPSRGRLLHTTIAQNQGGAGTAGVRVAGGSVVTLTNTILVKHDTGINVAGGCTATLTATLWGSGPWANGADWGDVGKFYTGTINIWGNPDFLNPTTGDYHIASSSDARDEGVDAGVGTDLDGTPRDANPDLGAYEASGLNVIQVVKVASATLLNPGDAVTYTVVVTNPGAADMTNVALTDTLPALQRASNATADKGVCAITDPGYGGRVTCTLGLLGGHQALHITITAQVTTVVPASLPQVMRNTAQAASDQALQTTAYADTTLQNCHARVNGLAPTYGIVQAAVDAASAGDDVWIAGTCLGAFERAGLFQQVYVSKSLTLRGGYSTDFAAWDPDVYTTTLDAEGQGRVVYVTGPVNVAVETLRLTGGNANGLGSVFIPFNDVGGGVYAITATVTLSGTHVAGNIASTDYVGYGGGVGVISATLTLIETTLSDNIASSAGFGMGSGGGLFGEFSTVRLERSRLENNVASGGGMLAGFGGGAYFYESDLEASATLWLSNTVSTSSDWGRGGGLYVVGTRPFTLTNCVLADNRAHDASGASGSGLWVDGAPGVLLHPTIARNQDGEGITADDTATVTITNAIIAGHSVGIRVMGNSTVTVNSILWHDNVSDTDSVTGTILVNNDLTGDPDFADGYHINVASAAIDRGVNAGVSEDIDGDPRPMGSGYDLGADELVAGTPVGGFTALVSRPVLAPWVWLAALASLATLTAAFVRRRRT